MPAPIPPDDPIAVPDTPDRTEGQDTFNTKAFAFNDWFAPFQAWLVTVLAYIVDAIAWVEDRASAAAASALAALNSATGAAASATSSANAAAAAAAAAGLPATPEFGQVFRSEGIENLKDANFTAEVGRVYDIDTSGGAFTVTVPASLAVGDWVGLRDISGTWGVNNLTVNMNGHKIFGVAENESLDINHSTVFLEYRSVSEGLVY